MLVETEREPVSSHEALSWLLLPPAAVAFTLNLSLGHRPDWLGHFLAGFGATLILVLAALRITRGRTGTLVLTTGLAVALGWLAEQSVFALGGPDSMDFHVQSLGAGLAGTALLMGRAEETPPLPCLLVAGATVLLGGFFAFVA